MEISAGRQALMAKAEFDSITNPPGRTGIYGSIEGEGESEWERKGRRRFPVSGQDKQGHVFGELHGCSSELLEYYRMY